VKISTDVLTVLNQCEATGCTLFLPQEQLDRTLYMAVNKVLQCMGGKWTRNVGGFAFKTEAAALLDSAILTGEVTDTKKVYQFYPTPAELADYLVELASIKPGQRICEPSAGEGAIADVLVECHGEDINLHLVELNAEMASSLKGRFQNVVCGDFLQQNEKYDCFVANPPFTRQQDIDHINHMLDCTKPGGTVVSVASASVLYGETKKAVAFRDRISTLGGYIEPLPERTFKVSGTMVATCVVIVESLRDLGD
jgi:phospholipid N-methyltransferase